MKQGREAEERGEEKGRERREGKGMQRERQRKEWKERNSFVLAFKTLMQADQIIRALDPEINFSRTAVESSAVLLRDQFNMEAVADTAVKQVSRSTREVVYRIPSLVEATTKWLDQYEKGRLSVHVDTSDLSPQVDHLDKALSKGLDRLIIGLMLAGWLVGAAIASTGDITVGNIQLADLAYYMFLAGAVVAAVIIFQALMRLNKEEDLE